MQVKPSNSLKFGMSFDFERSDFAKINDNAFFKLASLSKQDKLELAKLSGGVKSLGIPQIDKKGKVLGLKISTTAQDRDYGLKALFMELADLFKGKKAKFTKIIKPEDMTLENLKRVVNQTTISYKRRSLFSCLKTRKRK